MNDFITEISVTVKDESCRITEKDLVYDPIKMHPEEPRVKALIDSALSKFKLGAESPSIILKSKTTVQS